MAVYIVTGKLGGGKTLCMVGKIREYLQAGRPVATNIDIDLLKLIPGVKSPRFYRLPDRPAIADLGAIGAVDTAAQEERNGALVLDECGMWLNSRNWSDKGRQAVIDWLLHSRKLGWDVFLIIQNVALLDKQIRDAIAEYVVHCRRLDRLNIPLVGRLIHALSLGLVSGRMPQVHLAVVSYGVGLGAIKADTWWYRGRDLYAAYSTRQIIDEESGGSWCAWVPPLASELPRALRSRSMRLKPKLPEVAAVMALPPSARIAALRAVN